MLESVADALRLLVTKSKQPVHAAMVFGGGLMWAVLYPLNSWLNRSRTIGGSGQ
jgi:hypothetical protein